MPGIPFIKDFKFDYGTAMEVTPLVRRVVANNPSPFTFKGTGTYIIGHGNVAVVDPGPDQQEHIDAVLRALRGETVTHTLTVNRTTGCSYVTDPEQAEFTASGGTGQFRVITTPNNCQWNAVNGLQALGVQITSGFSGTGGGLVRYSVQAHTRDVDADGFIEIAGLSGQNPNGRHRIILRKR